MLSHLEYKTLVEQSPIMIWRSNKEGLCDYFNDVWLCFRGKSLEEEYGNGWATGVHPEDYDHCLKVYLENFELQKSFEMEYRLMRHDGVYRWILDKGSPFFDENGQFLGFIGSCIDITTRIEANKTLNLLEESRSKQMAEAASVIAHQWKQPLNNLAMAISLFVKKYENKKLDDAEVKKFKEKYQELIYNLNNTINDFRNFFQSSNKKLTLDVCETLQKVLRMMEDSFVHNKIEIVLNKRDCGSYYAKQTDLSQVFLNILSNSKEAFQINKIKNRKIAITLDKDDIYNYIMIHDNAGGVKNDDLDHLKEQNFSTKKAFGGSGIGLYISDVILNQLGGELEVQNKDNGLLTTIKVPL